MSEKKEYTVIAGNGINKPIKVTLTRRELSDMIKRSILESVIASSAIEGIEPPSEEESEKIFKNLDELPDSLLTTDKEE